MLVNTYDKTASDIDLAYSAGFFDGEGSISIAPKRRKGCAPEEMAFGLTLQVSQLDPRPLKFLSDRFGGAVCVKSALGHTHLMHDWRITGARAERFLRAVLPYLIHKKEQAEVALKYRDQVSGRPRGRYGLVDAEYAALIKRVRNRVKYDRMMVSDDECP